MTVQKSFIKTEGNSENLNFPRQHLYYAGKVRGMHTTKDNCVAGVVSNRVSAFDHILPKPIKYKGAVLNLISARALKATADLVPNWMRLVPNARTTVGVLATPIKVEMVIRGSLAGHAYREYIAGERTLCGVPMPEGMKEFDYFPEPIITPTTKESEGHDEDISRDEILNRGLATEEQYLLMEEYTRALFDFGCKDANKQGLILLDTKYEFGIYDGKVILIDELHTPDSSRYIYLEGFEERQAKGEKQKHLSKEFLREKLIELGFEGKDKQVMPDLDEAFLVSVSERYLELYKALTGEEFPREEADKAEDKDYLFKSGRLALNSLRGKHQKVHISIVMGSESDLKVMDKAALMLENLGIAYELTILSAHRTPLDVANFAMSAYARGIRVIIAGAGGAAHLAGMLAASCALPVIGVPVNSSNSIKGLESLFSTVAMPSGVPVATVAIDGADNAAILAAQILGTSDEMVYYKLTEYKSSLIEKVAAMRKNVITAGYFIGEEPFGHDSED